MAHIAFEKNFKRKESRTLFSDSLSASLDTDNNDKARTEARRKSVLEHK